MHVKSYSVMFLEGCGSGTNFAFSLPVVKLKCDSIIQCDPYHMTMRKIIDNKEPRIKYKRLGGLKYAGFSIEDSSTMLQNNEIS